MRVARSNDESQQDRAWEDERRCSQVYLPYLKMVEGNIFGERNQTIYGIDKKESGMIYQHSVPCRCTTDGKQKRYGKAGVGGGQKHYERYTREETDDKKRKDGGRRTKNVTRYQLTQNRCR